MSDWHVFSGKRIYKKKRTVPVDPVILVFNKYCTVPIENFLSLKDSVERKLEAKAFFALVGPTL